MTPRLLSVLMILAGGLLFIVFWAASIGFVYWDVYRRNLPWRQQIAWIAVVALLPLLGFFFYLFARFIYPSLAGSKRANSQFKKRETLPLRTTQGQTYLPTIAMEPAVEHSSAGVKPSPGGRSQLERTGPRYVFSLLSGPETGKEYFLNRLPACIGRGSEADIRLDNDRSVSRRHAEIYDQGGWLYLRDLDSRHGTQINGIWIADQRLEPGDEIQVGSTLLHFGSRKGRS